MPSCKWGFCIRAHGHPRNVLRVVAVGGAAEDIRPVALNCCCLIGMSKGNTARTWANKKAGRETGVCGGSGGPGCLQSGVCSKLSVWQCWGRRKQNCFCATTQGAFGKLPSNYFFLKRQYCFCRFYFGEYYLAVQSLASCSVCVWQVSQLTNAASLLKPPHESLCWGRGKNWVLIYGQVMMGWRKTQESILLELPWPGRGIHPSL